MYTIAESTGDNGASIALDETTNMLYVGGVLSIYKLNAGGPTELPSFVDKLELDTNVVGSLFFGIAIDPAGGYGKSRDPACTGRKKIENKSGS